MDIIKNIIIFIVIFFIIMWLQYNDDNKFNKINKRISIYDKIKIPLFSAISVILIKELNLNSCTNLINPIMVINTSSKISDDIFVGPPDF
jgi:hypothetical protein